MGVPDKGEMLVYVEGWSCYSVRCRGLYSHDLGDEDQRRAPLRGNLGVYVKDVR